MEREAILCARRLLEDPNDFIGPIRKSVLTLNQNFDLILTRSMAGVLAPLY